MATINAARFISEENMLGSIEKGKYAETWLSSVATTWRWLMTESTNSSRS